MMQLRSLLETHKIGLAALPDVTAFAGCAVVVFGANKLVPTMDPTFYKQLKKPSWNPPNWVFPAVWIPLKILQTVAAYVMVKHTPSSYAPIPAAIFLGHLALGTYWNVVFFGKHKLKQSLGWMGAFVASVFGCVASFYPVSTTAAVLMAPTSMWVCVAAKLNYDIYTLNRDKDAGGRGKQQ